MSPAPVSPLPDFTSDGLLPPGEYPLTIDQIDNSVLVAGRAGAVGWDQGWRRQLLKNLLQLADQLWTVGITNIFIDGSFTEDKDHPNDIDGYFECDLDRLKTGELERALNMLDPHKVWTWDPASRRPYQGYPKKQLPMWHQYRVELYPHVPGLPSGIHDRHGNELEFPSAFRQSRRDGQQRGIVKVIRGEKS